MLKVEVLSLSEWIEEYVEEGVAVVSCQGSRLKPDQTLLDVKTLLIQHLHPHNDSCKQKNGIHQIQA